MATTFIKFFLSQSTKFYFKLYGIVLLTYLRLIRSASVIGRSAMMWCRFLVADTRGCTCALGPAMSIFWGSWCSCCVVAHPLSSIAITAETRIHYARAPPLWRALARRTLNSPVSCHLLGPRLLGTYQFFSHSQSLRRQSNWFLSLDNFFYQPLKLWI